MNATLGNLPELIIALLALVAAGPDNDLLRVTQMSLLGSILRCAGWTQRWYSHDAQGSLRSG